MSAAASSSGGLSATVYIPPEFHGQIVGPKGETVQRIQKQFNCRIKLPLASAQISTIVISASNDDAIQNTIAELQKLTKFVPSTKPLSVVVLTIPHQQHGALIGSGGSVARGIEQKHNVSTTFPKRDEAQGSAKDQVTIIGVESAIEAAKKEMESILGKELHGGAPKQQAVKPSLVKLDLTSTPINEALFFPDDTGTGSFAQFCNYLGSAKKTVDIAIYTLSDDRISHVIETLVQEGVKVRLITEDSTVDAEGSDIRSLKQAGVNVQIENTTFLMHHKFAVIDSSFLLNGSFNWTRSASMGNQENVTATNHAPLVAAYEKQFLHIWERTVALPAGKLATHAR